ncbi:MAG: copper resistance D family protein, partial [Candidatus Rokuibacteriota bacterium]
SRPARALDTTLAITGAGALLLALAQGGLLAIQTAALANSDAGWPTAAMLGSTVGIAALVRIALALAVLPALLALRRSPASPVRGVLLLTATAGLSVSGALASHAIGRLDHQVWLLTITALHQAAVGTWIGGLVCAAVLAVRVDARVADAWLRPFSAVAATSVVSIAVTGGALWVAYVGTPAAAIGTSYGAMVLTKIVLFVALLVMGLLNHRALHGGLAMPPWRSRGLDADPATDRSILMRRRLEVEAGLAIVTVLVAASISSAPPAVDAGARRVTFDEIRAVFTPQWPRLSTPTLAELATASDLSNPDSPRTAEITAWSEFGHNLSGLFILIMGVLAILERTGRARWARHWPLLIIALAIFVAYSVDPEGWQTGAVGFWEHIRSPEVIQHKLMVLITALFGFAEWRVRSGRHPESPWRYAFPVAAIWAGVLLIAHVHEVGDSKSAFFMELSHLLLGLMSLVAGWARWLELRLPPAASGGPGRLWGPAFAVFGLLLLLYREG